MEFDFYWHFDRCIFYRINNWKWLRNSLTKKFQAYSDSKKLFQTNISSTSHSPAVNCSKMSSIFYRAALLLKQKRKVTTLIRRQRWISKVHKLTPTTFSRWNRGPKKGGGMRRYKFSVSHRKLLFDGFIKVQHWAPDYFISMKVFHSKWGQIRKI